MTITKESKHDAFLRLADRRVGRAMEEIRLVGQLSSRTYENTEEEAQIVVAHLDKGVQLVAQLLGVPYSTAIGEAAQRAVRTGHLVTNTKDDGPVNEMDVAMAIEHIVMGQPDTAKAILKKALTR
tara:strand:- start:183 stop:557 length:375 start_codon:yes stop_codon:yes gene_type:complete